MRVLSFAAALLYFAKLGQQADITELAEDLDFRFIQGKSVINDNDHCMSVKFCRETLLGRKADDNGVKALSSYVLSNPQVTPQNTITATLTNATPNNQQAASLQLQLTFYQEGIMQVNLSCTGEEPRFGISSTGIGVEWSQLEKVTNLSTKASFGQKKGEVFLNDSDGEIIKYDIIYNPFQIIQYINNQVTMAINNDNALRYASLDAPHNTYMDGTDQLIEGYEIGVGVTINAEHAFGLPQRASDQFRLQYNQNYRLFNQDKFDHPYGSNDPLYGSWPYLTGHQANLDASVIWMNSSETYVQLEQVTNPVTFTPATLGYFVSVGGKFELFIFGTTHGPKANQQLLSEITGYAPLPPIHSLGYHYCKYEENSADLMMKRDAEFTHYGFPVDVFWSDLYYTQDFEYFVFNRDTFPIQKVQALNAQIAASKRRLVMINDPHIRANDEYFVFQQGMQIQNGAQTQGDFANIFIREPDAQDVFVANCWPGLSVWIDYLNTNAAEFWQSLYLRKNFVGSNYLYGTWNDMNEPSVFNNSTEIDQMGMPMNNTHIQTDGSVVQHRWVHNAYGALMHRASWLGLYARDNSQQRPFVLTRSTFFGSQRYGAIWTGDSVVAYSDIPLYIQMSMSLGISGMIFSGADLPGFVGNPTDDNFIEEYQAGVFYPFMRAHANIDTLNYREPWLRSERVQQVIRNALLQRYAQTHYLYTTFKHSTETGTPIIRPMWYEFPKDANTFDLDKQFMFGDKFLVAPKSSSPTAEHIVFHSPVNTQAYLPVGVNWYYYWSGQPVAGSTTLQDIPVADNEQGVWIREGSIIPLLNVQKDRQSLLQAINDPVDLLIYPDLAKDTASGDLYLDDGETNNYLQKERTEVQFNWSSSKISRTSVITVTKTLTDDNQYPKASGKFINRAQIFNVKQEPNKVVNQWATNSNQQVEADAKYIFNQEESSLTLHDFYIPVDSGLTFNSTVTLFTIHWPLV